MVVIPSSIRSRPSGHLPSEIESLYWAAIVLRDFIEMQPANSPVIWCGDRKTRVVDTPHFKEACNAIVLFESFIEGKAVYTRELS